jgi:dihydroorotate dehydrogenase electron transfer subunit
LRWSPSNFGERGRKKVSGVYSEVSSQIVEQVSVAQDCYLLTLEAPQVATAASPGQFVMLRCSTGYDPFLRRPLSIHQALREQGKIRLLYRVKGRGTAWLSERRPGEKVSLLGPLGRGFAYSGRGKKGLLVGAGVGVAPLLFLAEELSSLEWQLVILIGARTASQVLREDAFARCGAVKVVTEDGSAGEKGLLLQFLEEKLQENGFDSIFGCGPLPVLKGIQDFSRKFGIPAQIALEERMACGVGACFGCVCQGKDRTYFRVCREGPVFAADEVIIDG